MNLFQRGRTMLGFLLMFYRSFGTATVANSNKFHRIIKNDSFIPFVAF